MNQEIYYSHTNLKGLLIRWTCNFRSSSYSGIWWRLDRSWSDCLRQRSHLKIPIIADVAEPHTANSKWLFYREPQQSFAMIIEQQYYIQITIYVCWHWLAYNNDTNLPAYSDGRDAVIQSIGQQVRHQVGWYVAAWAMKVSLFLPRYTGVG